VLAHGVDDLHRRRRPHVHRGVDIKRYCRCKHTPRWEALARSKGNGHVALNVNGWCAGALEIARLLVARSVHVSRRDGADVCTLTVKIIESSRKAILSTKTLTTCCQSKNLISRHARPINADAHKLRTWRSTHSEMGKATQRSSPIANAPLMREDKDLRFCSWVRSSFRGAQM